MSAHDEPGNEAQRQLLHAEDTSGTDNNLGDDEEREDDPIKDDEEEIDDVEGDDEEEGEETDEEYLLRWGEEEEQRVQQVEEAE
jgi:hypothetical protein